MWVDTQHSVHYIFEVLFSFTVFLYFVPNILSRIVAYLLPTKRYYIVGLIYVFGAATEYYINLSRF